MNWSRTRAYSLGLNGLYLNQAGREKNGIVAPGQAAHQLLKEISARLLAARDPESGAPMIADVETMGRSSAGSKFAPDLVVGYRAGYRASWSGALGAVKSAVVQDNLEAWIGDHCVAASEVPGVLFANRKMRAGSAELKDLTVTLLKFFGIAPPQAMSGRAIF